MTLDIAAIKARADKASGQSWQAWNMVHGDTGKPMSPEELGEYVKNSVLKSIEDGGSADQFLFVSFDGEENPDICHVGNGPNRAANASFIAHARTDIPTLIAALEASEAARVKAEQERDALKERTPDWLADLMQQYPLGTQLVSPIDDLDGEVIGYYRTREWKYGLVLQQNGKRIVHVYQTKWWEQS